MVEIVRHQTTRKRNKSELWSYSISQEICTRFCFAVLCCGYTLTDFPISIRLTSLALWQSNHCPSASKANLINMDKYFMWIHYERLHNHNKAKHNKTVCIFLEMYCTCRVELTACHFTANRRIAFGPKSRNTFATTESLNKARQQKVMRSINNATQNTKTITRWLLICSNGIIYT